MSGERSAQLLTVTVSNVSEGGGIVCACSKGSNRCVRSTGESLLPG